MRRKAGGFVRDPPQSLRQVKPVRYSGGAADPQRTHPPVHDLFRDDAQVDHLNLLAFSNHFVADPQPLAHGSRPHQVRGQPRERHGDEGGNILERMANKGVTVTFVSDVIR
jgi:hypothetical protein